MSLLLLQNSQGKRVSSGGVLERMSLLLLQNSQGKRVSSGGVLERREISSTKIILAIYIYIYCIHTFKWKG